MSDEINAAFGKEGVSVHKVSMFTNDIADVELHCGSYGPFADRVTLRCATDIARAAYRARWIARRDEHYDTEMCISGTTMEMAMDAAGSAMSDQPSPEMHSSLYRNVRG